MSLPSPLELQRELEWRKCARDPVYFLNTYWSIEVVGEGYQVPGLRGYQEADIGVMRDMCSGDELDRSLWLKARQIGMTTMAYGFAFWDAWFHGHHPWLGTAQSEGDAQLTLTSKVKIPFSRLPAWMKDRGPSVVKENLEVIEFDNGSKVTAVHSGSHAARGQAVYGVIMDEAGFMEDAGSLFAALDPLCYGPMLVFSTANGMGDWFHTKWLESQLLDGGWVFRFHPWSVVPGRDEAWYAKQKRKYKGEPHLLAQEFPASPAEAFSKSGRNAFHAELYEYMPWEMPEARYDIGLLDTYLTEGVDIEEQLDRALLEGDAEADLELWVWEHPYTERDDQGVLLRPPNFVISADVAEGLEHGDRSAVTVLDANNFEEVASFVGHIPVEDLGALIEWLGYWYFTALVGPERNNQGLVPLNYLQRVGYPRMFRMDSLASLRRGDRTPRYGYHTNRATKPKMVLDFLKALRDEQVFLRDPRWAKEALTFLSDGSGSYGASSGNHDDKIMSVLIGWQLVLDVGNYPLVWEDSGPKPTTLAEVFDLMFLDEDDSTVGASPLYRPLGQVGAPAWSPERTWLASPPVPNGVDIRS